MSNPKNDGGQGKNQPAAAKAELSIPTLSNAPLVQPGEESPPAVEHRPTDQAFAAIKHAAPSPADSNDVVMPASGRMDLKALQAQADAQASRTLARNTPVMFRPEQEQESRGDSIRFDMPTDGPVAGMRNRGWQGNLREDQMIEPVADLMHWQDKAAQLAFNEELVVIRIHETDDQSAENPVPVGVNGRMIYLKRGQDVVIRRKYVERLFNARTETVNTQITRGHDDEPRNSITKRAGFKYPFAIIQDDNPIGRRWARQQQEQRR